MRPILREKLESKKHFLVFECLILSTFLVEKDRDKILKL